jgi:hypothetical protein
MIMRWKWTILLIALSGVLGAAVGYASAVMMGPLWAVLALPTALLIGAGAALLGYALDTR